MMRAIASAVTMHRIGRGDEHRTTPVVGRPTIAGMDVPFLTKKPEAASPASRSASKRGVLILVDDHIALLPHRDRHYLLAEAPLFVTPPPSRWLRPDRVGILLPRARFHHDRPASPPSPPSSSSARTRSVRDPCCRRPLQGIAIRYPTPNAARG